MREPQFNVVAGASDWGSPLSEQPTFDIAKSCAREYVSEQKRSGAPTA